MSDAKTGTEVAERRATVPAEYADYARDAAAGIGVQDLRAEERLIPILRVLQPLSPEVLENNPPGLKAGMFLNTATMESIDGVEGFEMLIVARDYNFVEFVPRSAGGGFVGIRAPDDPLIAKLIKEHGRGGRVFGRLPGPDGHEIVQTHYVYVVALTEPVPTEAVLIFTSTGIGPFKRMVNFADRLRIPTPVGAIKGPSWAWRWRVKTALEKNEKGQWYNYRIELAKPGAPLAESLMPADHPCVKRARALWDAIAAGTARADVEAAATGAASDTGTSTPSTEDIRKAQQEDLDDEIPM